MDDFGSLGMGFFRVAVCCPYLFCIPAEMSLVEPWTLRMDSEDDGLDPWERKEDEDTEDMQGWLPLEQEGPPEEFMGTEAETNEPPAGPASATLCFGAP